jgi:hypothetical protein
MAASLRRVHAVLIRMACYDPSAVHQAQMFFG